MNIRMNAALDQESLDAIAQEIKSINEEATFGNF